ncbi:50S ribosomal L25 [Gossypium arboreum]|uniref:50S ribosomal L25 n=2 Tax=Gossypium arboreum TaxID=29729 RepID=A0A0B0P4E2_GOSAR|nr:50S ribosomal L25 [Gossypium arboreum]
MEKMGQSTKSTWPGPPHTDSLHGRVNLAELKHGSHGEIEERSLVLMVNSKLRYPHARVEKKPVGTTVFDEEIDCTARRNRREIRRSLRYTKEEQEDDISTTIEEMAENQDNQLPPAIPAELANQNPAPRQRKSTGVVTTHDVYYLWCMSNGYIIDLTYFIALAIRHQTERHRRGVISIGPYVTRLMFPQGISSMLSMRMIKRHRGTYPLQYHLAQSTEEEAPEDITDDVPTEYKDPPSQPPPHSRHAAASYADISECLNRFEQRAKGMRNGPKTEKMGQSTKSTRPGPPHTGYHFKLLLLVGGGIDPD